MTDNIDFKLTGLDDAVKRLRQFTPKLQKKGLRSAARKAMNIVRDAARAKAETFNDPNTPENIAKNIVTQESTKKSKQVGGVAMRVGILGGARQYSATRENKRKRRVGQRYKTLGDKKNPGGDTWYWRFKEFGTEHQKADPFMRPAYTENLQTVQDKFAVELNAEIDNLMQGK